VYWCFTPSAANLPQLWLKPIDAQSCALTTLATMSAGLHSNFVGNITNSADENDVYQLFSQIGPVVSVRLMRDKNNPDGGHKCFGFVDFADPRLVHAAIAQLDGVELKGRALRVDAAGPANSGGGGRGGGRGGGGGGRAQPGGPSGPGGYVYPDGGAAPPVNYAGQYGAPPASGFCHQPPTGGYAYPPAAPSAPSAPAVPAAPASGGMGGDEMSDEQLWDIVSQMKESIERDVDTARRTLTQNPQIGMAVLRGQIRLGMVTPQSIASVMSAAAAQQQQQQPPPQPMVQQPPPQPQPPAQPQQPNPQQQALIQQVMQLTPEQIAQLPDEQRSQLMMLRQQVMSGQLQM